jgi:hypothetical protein
MFRGRKMYFSLAEWAWFFQARNVMQLLRKRSNFFALQKSSTLFVVEAE